MTNSPITPGHDTIVGGASGITPFSIAVPDTDVADLHRRLRATRWPDPATVEDWSQGVPLPYLQQLCRYWADEYDWSTLQNRLNAIEQFRTELNGLPIHLLHVRSPQPGALPWSSPTGGRARSRNSST